MSGYGQDCLIKFLILLGMLSIFTACGIDAGKTEAKASESAINSAETDPLGSAQALQSANVITIGDIDPDEPAKKIKRFQPLVDYLASHLTDYGITSGRVVIANDIDQMIQFFEDGSIDIYMDSPFPALNVQSMVGSEIILRRWKGGSPWYWTVYVAHKDSGINSVEDFVGKIVAFEDPFSTSGYVLPAGTLAKRGFSLSEIPRATANAAPDKINYFFARDEENVVEYVLRNLVPGGAALSNQDYDDLPAEIKAEIVTFDPTVVVPRQVVSVRPGISPALVAKVEELLIGLNQTEEGLAILQHIDNTLKFDALPPEADASIEELRTLMGFLDN